MRYLESINISFWILQTIAMMITAFLLPRLTVSGPLGALGAVIGLAFVNAHIWDAALFFQIPNSFTSHALLLIVANGVVFWILVKVLPGIEVQGVLPAIAAPIVFSICSILINEYGKDVDWKKVYDVSLHEVTEIKKRFTATPTP